MAVKLTCYNRGCGQKFDPNENGEGGLLVLFVFQKKSN